MYLILYDLSPMQIKVWGLWISHRLTVSFDKGQLFENAAWLNSVVNIYNDVMINALIWQMI